jgi:hydroxymethylpyrimidine pyrophosphatase-like HAD family hydrolase
VGPEDVVVFGDMPNDIAAFDWVREGGGRAVAMAHAHPDLLVAATDITATNDEDGVALFLASLCLPVPVPDLIRPLSDPPRDCR